MEWRVQVAGEGIEAKFLIVRASRVATKLIVLSHKPWILSLYKVEIGRERIMNFF
jgi:hypothetical protein